MGITGKGTSQRGSLRGQAPLKLDKPPPKSSVREAFRAKQHFESFKMLGGRDRCQNLSLFISNCSYSFLVHP